MKRKHKKKGRTRANLFWTKRIEEGTAKMLISFQMREDLKKKGTHEGVQTRLYGNKLLELIGDLLPDCMTSMRERYDGSTEWYKLVCTRASYGQPTTLHPSGKNELARFKTPEWEDIYHLIRHARLLNTPLHLDDLLHTIEQLIELRNPPGKSCLYIRADHKRPEIVDIGITDNLPQRNRDHSRTFNRVRYCISFADIKVARGFEKKLLANLATDCGQLVSGNNSQVRIQSKLLSNSDAADFALDYLKKHHEGITFKATGKLLTPFTPELVGI